MPPEHVWLHVLQSSKFVSARSGLAFASDGQSVLAKKSSPLHLGSGDPSGWEYFESEHQLQDSSRKHSEHESFLAQGLISKYS